MLELPTPQAAWLRDVVVLCWPIGWPPELMRCSAAAQTGAVAKSTTVATTGVVRLRRALVRVLVSSIAPAATPREVGVLQAPPVMAIPAAATLAYQLLRGLDQLRKECLGEKHSRHSPMNWKRQSTSTADATAPSGMRSTTPHHPTPQPCPPTKPCPPNPTDLARSYQPHH